MRQADKATRAQERTGGVSLQWPVALGTRPAPHAPPLRRVVGAAAVHDPVWECHL